MFNMYTFFTTKNIISFLFRSDYGGKKWKFIPNRTYIYIYIFFKYVFLFDLKTKLLTISNYVLIQFKRFLVVDAERR